ncbi:MAG TPA: SoxR reducing system RseC family protein [Bacteroidales bacterium]|mgnify:CR=1 FL=1|nr:SoxR reducing system RseC family protein [Bacteroidales bacterium]HPT01518.1 SoxR reducing system RseC family protein [Bacteroidales bacterium]
MKPEVSHQGRIVEMDDQKISVQIISLSACATCRAKGMCSASDMTEKLIEVKNEHKYVFHQGDHVNLVMKQSMGNKAVILGYFLPFVLLLITLLISSQYTGELYAGLLSLGILVPYYILLYLLRGRLSKSFNFKIEPLNAETGEESKS